DAERARLGREIAAQSSEAERARGKLANPGFMANAPEEVVEQRRERLSEVELTLDRLREALRDLG
ncbi:MAG TPA: hypothetical protein VJ979_11860, partial [Actinomycetota bacterium]|nr:hypothetical protein [Actinomycetota bacterium]